MMDITELSSGYYRYSDRNLCFSGVPSNWSWFKTVIFIVAHDENKPWFSLGTYSFSKKKFVWWDDGEYIDNPRIHGKTDHDKLQSFLDIIETDPHSSGWLIEFSGVKELGEFLTQFPHVNLDITPIERKLRDVLVFLSIVKSRGSLHMDVDYYLELAEDVLIDLLGAETRSIVIMATDLLAALVSTVADGSTEAIMDFIDTYTEDFTELYLRLRGDYL